MSRMPPSLSGSLLCANAAVADIASAAAKTPVTTFFMTASLMPAALLAALNFCRRNHAAWHHERQPIAISAKRNDRHDGSAQTRRMGGAQRYPSIAACKGDGYRFAPPILRIAMNYPNSPFPGT